MEEEPGLAGGIGVAKSHQWQPSSIALRGFLSGFKFTSQGSLYDMLHNGTRLCGSEMSTREVRNQDRKLPERVPVVTREGRSTGRNVRPLQ
jgi:hypothetical protein